MARKLRKQASKQASKVLIKNIEKKWDVKRGNAIYKNIPEAIVKKWLKGSNFGDDMAFLVKKAVLRFPTEKRLPYLAYTGRVNIQSTTYFFSLLTGRVPYGVH